MSDETYAIVGANLAGGHAAHQLRREGFEGRIALIGAERHLPYERPPLSKAVLIGEEEPKSTEIWPSEAYEAAAIDLHLGVRATHLWPKERRIDLDDGASLAVDKVLLATGSRPRPVDLPGADQAGVCELRDIDDAVWLRDHLQPGTRVVVIGAGFIGAEVAAAATTRGCQVTMVEIADLPLQRVLGPEVGEIYAEMHRDKGVDVRLGVTVDRIEGTGVCRAVTLSNGSSILADLVVLGVGVVPSTELAESAGLALENGIVVDYRCQTSIENVFASGDVAARPSSFVARRVRLESWQNAQNQSIAAARSMLGSGDLFDEVPWFWSDQYDVNLQVAGFPSPTDRLVWRGERSSRYCAVFYLRDGRVSAVVGLNRRREVRAAMKLIAERTMVEAEALADESIDIRTLRTPADR